MSASHGNPGGGDPIREHLVEAPDHAPYSDAYEWQAAVEIEHDGQLRDALDRIALLERENLTLRWENGGLRQENSNLRDDVAVLRLYGGSL